MKAQIYIVMIVMIIIAIAAVINLGSYSHLPVLKEQSSMFNQGEIIHNINNELYLLNYFNFSNQTIDDFINFSEQYGKEKNLNLTIQSQ